MTIASLKDLEKLVKLCRKVGIDAIKVDGIEFSLASVPYKTSVPKRQVYIDPGQGFSSPGIDADTRIDTPDELTEDQLLFYSAQGHNEVI